MAGELVKKYDSLAEGFAERSYANLAFYMRRRLWAATCWGAPIRPPDRVVELGCGDGYLAQLFVKEGFRYCGVEISPKMAAMGEQRLRNAGMARNFAFVVGDAGQMALSEPVDLVIACMRTFFGYVHLPAEVLGKLRPYIRKKIILDLNPRRDLSLPEAMAVLRRVGFRRVAWRPFFVPLEKRLPCWLMRALVVGEYLPGARSIPLLWKFHVLLKGEL